jgi:hypothetical protein
MDLARYTVGRPDVHFRAARNQYNRAPVDYAITDCHAVLLIDATVSRLVNDGLAIAHENVRDYAEQTTCPAFRA